ncbi:MAG: winged helix-turn-helix domain-containing protein [bacterium]
MEQKIGETAGKIWKELSKSGEMAISQVPKAIKERDTISYLAMGWLAREGKLIFRTKGNKTLVVVGEKD